MHWTASAFDISCLPKQYIIYGGAITISNSLITLVIQEAQLMLTNPGDALRGQEVIKHCTVDMLGMVSY